VRKILEQIPYLQLHELALIEAGAGTARLGLRKRKEMTNHVGIIHAGALYTLAETATGVAAQGAVTESVILLRRGEIHYRRPARDDVTASAHSEPAAIEEAREQFEAAGRADLSMEVAGTVSDGTIVFDGVFEYALRPRN